MRQRLEFLVLLPILSVGLAACGSSSSSSTAPASASTSTASAASSSTASSATTSTTTSAGSGSASSSAAGTTPPTGGASPSGGGGSSGGGSVNARVPATFSIHAGGKLTPATVSAPAFLAVQVTIDSTDASGHQIVLRTPTPHTLSVPAHGHVSLLISGLRAGAYAIDIDGAPKGSLIIGGEPGP